MSRFPHTEHFEDGNTVYTFGQPAYDRLSPLGERQAELLGGHFKRKAKIMQTARDRNQALADAAKHYRQAAELHRKVTGRTDYYPALKYCKAQVHCPDYYHHYW